MRSTIGHEPWSQCRAGCSIVSFRETSRADVRDEDNRITGQVGFNSFRALNRKSRMLRRLLLEGPLSGDIGHLLQLQRLRLDACRQEKTSSSAFAEEMHCVPDARQLFRRSRKPHCLLGLLPNVRRCSSSEVSRSLALRRLAKGCRLPITTSLRYGIGMRSTGRRSASTSMSMMQRHRRRSGFHTTREGVSKVVWKQRLRRRLGG